MTTTSYSSDRPAGRPPTQCPSSPCRSVAEHLRLGRLSDGGEAPDEQLLRALYAHARGQDDRRQLYANDLSFAKGWLNLEHPETRKLIAPFVPMDEGEEPIKARKKARANLEAVAWNDVLGIADPPLHCQVKIHGRQWGLRFVATTPCLKGRELLNEELPEASIVATPAAPTPTTPTPQASPMKAAAVLNTLLKKGSI